MSATLSTLRDRVRVLVESASGAPEPLVTTASSATCATLRDRIEATLQDSANAIWTEADIDEAMRKALEQYSRVAPTHNLTAVTMTIASREIDISNIVGLIRVEKVWWSYDSATPGYPPALKQFQVWPGGILYIDDTDEPAAGEVVRIWYTKNHTIADLDGGEATTIPADEIGYLVTGAAGYALEQRATDLVESLTVDSGVVTNLRTQAADYLKNFRYGANMEPPAWQRFQHTYDQNDIDEAIRWAVHQYNEVYPQELETTLTFAADGYEVATTTIAGLIDITRVWCPYTSSDPEDPPEWREFEQWPGVLRMVDAEIEAADIARVWYTRPHTLNGLDSETTTTLPDRHATILVTGAAGIAVQMRSQEMTEKGLQNKMQVWSEARLKEFDRMLSRLRRTPSGNYGVISPRRRQRVPRT